MASQKFREDRFSWKDGDFVFPPGFKTKEQRIKDGTYKPAKKSGTKQRPVRKKITGE